MQQVADALGISKDTLERRVKEDEPLRAALVLGRANTATAVAETAFKLATSGNQPAMTMFWLKTRLGWREKDTHAEARRDCGNKRPRGSRCAAKNGTPCAVVCRY